MHNTVTKDNLKHTIGEAESAVVVDVDILVEQMSAGTGVHFRGGALPLVVAEHLLPRSIAAWAHPCCKEE